mmetsp:Transcript_72607/g.114960  ORF Transcript_72607/g.114960 Transcript_72607/m.114960 type:complete len:138 (+) Transcript_72607:764-1177(+)
MSHRADRVEVEGNDNALASFGENACDGGNQRWQLSHSFPTRAFQCQAVGDDMDDGKAEAKALEPICDLTVIVARFFSMVNATRIKSIHEKLREVLSGWSPKSRSFRYRSQVFNMRMLCIVLYTILSHEIYSFLRRTQ